MSTETELQVAVKTSAKKDSRKKGRADRVLFLRGCLSDRTVSFYLCNDMSSVFVVAYVFKKVTSIIGCFLFLLIV